MSKQISEKQLKYILELSKKSKIKKLLLRDNLKINKDIVLYTVSEARSLINKIRLLNG